MRLSCLAASVACMVALAAQPDCARAQGVDGFGRHLADLINAYRQEHGLGPLVMSDDLVAIASRHSSTMAATQAMSHDGFASRHHQSGSRVCVENVASNFQTAEALLNAWRHSPAHQRNLVEAQVSRMGIARQARYVTFFACL